MTNTEPAPSGNSRDVLLADLAEVIALRVTAQVIVELVDEDSGQHAGVVSQGQARRQIWNLPHHFQDLPQACGMDGSRWKMPAGPCPHKQPPHSTVSYLQLSPPAFGQRMAYPEWLIPGMGPGEPGFTPDSSRT